MDKMGTGLLSMVKKLSLLVKPLLLGQLSHLIEKKLNNALHSN